ncbi:methionyl-tRNA formyltransferase [bacterium]|nr:methionyl-tRNA formyltransferase [bacterium]
MRKKAISKKKNKKKRIKPKDLKIIFIGTPEFAAIILRELILSHLKPILVITRPDKPVGRKQIVVPPIVKIVAEKYNIDVIQTEEIGTKEKEISKLKPDLILVAAFGHIIPKKILKIPKYGCLNIHPSLLPKYRGPAPIRFALLNGEKETGVTINLMTEKLDTGPIVASRKFKINDKKFTGQELERELARMGVKLFLDILEKWINGDIKPVEQDESKASYTRIIKKEDGKIDWSKSAEEIERKVRAFNPWPSAFCYAGKKILKIWQASILKDNEKSPKGPIGKTFLAPNNKIAVKCKKDFLVIEELQLEGKRKVKVQDFLKGNVGFVGTILK